jgi:hypothetical protein
MIGWYHPNAAGARTLREAKPLYVGDDLVTAQVYKLPACSEPAIAIFVGLKLVLEGPVPLEITEAHHVNPFIQRFIEAYVIEQTRNAYRAACESE